MSIEHGIQFSSNGAIKFGKQSVSSDFDRRPNKGDRDTAMRPTRTASKGSGGMATQTKGIKGQNGANGYGKPKSGSKYSGK